MTLLAEPEPYQLDIFEPNQLPLRFPRPRTARELESLIFDDGRAPYPHQARNIHFLKNTAALRGLCADDTGLGKTITACGIIKEFADEVLPVLIVCKSTLKFQWAIELFKTTSIAAQIISSSSDPIDEDAQAWIISYDLVKRLDPMSKDEMQPRLVVLDECQQIKNWESKRTQALLDFCRDIPYVVGTSATPIYNDAFEYFPFLHMIRPDRFNSRDDFSYMCELKRTSSGVWKRGGISRQAEPRWKNLTSDLIIRHKREDVAPDLPRVRRTNRFVQLGANESLVKELKKFVEMHEAIKDWEGRSSNLDTMTRADAMQARATSLMRMRHIIGDAKVSFALDYVKEFLNESDRRLTVFVHHKSVANAIIEGVNKMIADGEIDINKPYIMRGGMNEVERNQFVGACTSNGGWPVDDPRCRLLIASTQAAGEGINLQKCFDCLFVERQFNPPREEQAEGRFSRLGILIKTDFINAVYLTAIGTLDDWFHQLIEGKRNDLKRTHGDKEFYGGFWSGEDQIVADLMDMVALKAIGVLKKKREMN